MQVANYGKAQPTFFPNVVVTLHMFNQLYIYVRGFTTIFKCCVKIFLHFIVAPHVLQGAILDVEAHVKCPTYGT